MKLLIESAMVFFGTSIAAALVALAWPASVELVAAQAPVTALKPAAQQLASGLTAERPAR
ncbi:MAG TPA: hypothetical protein VN649_09990 [Ramlibacter sp.]|nr:hypothetical protein [Ramlibacter sp.]